MINSISMPTKLVLEGSHEAVRLWGWCKCFTIRSSNVWPGDAVVADELDLNHDEVEAALGELEASGFIECNEEIGTFSLRYGETS